VRPARTAPQSRAPHARGLLDRRRAAEHDEIGDADLPAAAGGVEIGLDALKHCQHAGKLLGLVHFPIALRLEPDPRAIGAPRLSEPRKVAAEAQAVCTSSETVRPEPSSRCFSAATSASRSAGDRPPDRILPQEILFRHFRPEVTDLRAHVAVAQLEPGARECIGIFGGIVAEAARDRRIGRVRPHRHVGGGHHRRHALAGRVRGRREILRGGIDRRPLLGARGAARQLPLVSSSMRK
jgi:hypothetical protein